MTNNNIEKFFMRNKHGNYAKYIAFYVTNLRDAKIFEGNPEDYKKYNNEIILVDSKKGLELISREMELLSKEINLTQNNLISLNGDYERLFFSNPHILEYIQQVNKCTNPLVGISEGMKNKIIEEIYKK